MMLSREGSELTYEILMSAWDKMKNAPIEPHVHVVHPSSKPGDWAMCASCMQWIQMPKVRS